MNRWMAVSLLAVAVLSGLVVAEGEQNYVSVTNRVETTAEVTDARAEEGALAVDLRVLTR